MELGSSLELPIQKRWTSLVDDEPHIDMNICPCENRVLMMVHVSLNRSRRDRRQDGNLGEKGPVQTMGHTWPFRLYHREPGCVHSISQIYSTSTDPLVLLNVVQEERRGARHFLPFFTGWQRRPRRRRRGNYMSMYRGNLDEGTNSRELTKIPSRQGQIRINE